MSTAEIIQVIRNKWTELGNDEQLSRAFLEEALSHKAEGGGALWVKYGSLELGTKPEWVFIPKGCELWEKIPQFVSNFEILTRDYDPERHCLLFLSVPNTAESSFGQMVRVNYKNLEQNTNSWSFCLD